MKGLSQYLIESVKKVNDGEGIIVFDIDDTLIKTDPNVIKIWKSPNGDKSKEIGLSTEEFAKDPDAKIHKDWFDLREFRDKEKVYRSIVNGTPIIKNLKIMDSYINAGYDFCFLTARGLENVVKDALNDLLMYRDDKGGLNKLGDIFKQHLSHGVNDDYKKYKGNSDAEKKANVLIDLCKRYKKVVFVDDDEKNVEGARNLNLPNLKVIKANK